MDRILDESHSVDKDNGEVSWAWRNVKDFLQVSAGLLANPLFFRCGRKTPWTEKVFLSFFCGILRNTVGKQKSGRTEIALQAS